MKVIGKMFGVRLCYITGDFSRDFVLCSFG